MKARKTVLLALALAGSLCLSACSEVHDLFNPPTFTPPATTASPNATPPLPTYAPPGTPITRQTVSGGQPAFISFKSSSIGFTVTATCKEDLATKIKVTVNMTGATQSFTAKCTTTPTKVLTLNTPSAPDAEGSRVVLEVSLSGSTANTADVVVTTGTD